MFPIVCTVASGEALAEEQAMVLTGVAFLFNFDVDGTVLWG